MRAEREKRAVVLTSEGERDAKINQAEGEKQRVIKESRRTSSLQINQPKAGRSDPGGSNCDCRRPASRRRGAVGTRRHGSDALRVAEEYVKQFGKLANEASSTLVIPATLSDISSMIAMATSVIKQQNKSA